MPLILATLLLIVFTAPAFAHDPLTYDGQDRWASLVSILVLGVFWLAYMLGARRTKPKLTFAALFHLALLVCLGSVLGPLDEWAETNEAVHMIQHMLFMTVIAPLWVISQPLPQLMAGTGRIMVRPWNALLKLTQYPLRCAYIHGFFIWFWHVPYFYVLALENAWWHIAEHACFIITAGLFWWAVLKSSRIRTPWALLAVLFTLMHTGVLGALLTFAPEPFYGDLEKDLAQQQLAGLIMWVAGGIPYMAASVWIGMRWYQQLSTRMGADLSF